MHHARNDLKSGLTQNQAFNYLSVVVQNDLQVTDVVLDVLQSNMMWLCCQGGGGKGITKPSDVSQDFKTPGFAFK